MGIGRQAVAVHLLAKLVQLLFIDAPLEIRTGVDARRAVSLNVNQVPHLLFRGGAKEIVEAHVVQGGTGLKRGNVTADRWILEVGPHHHRHGVPANERSNTPFHEEITRRHAGFLARRNRIAVRCIDRVRKLGARFRNLRRKPLEQILRPLDTLVLQYGNDRIDPLLGFDRIYVFA